MIVPRELTQHSAGIFSIVSLLLLSTVTKLLLRFKNRRAPRRATLSDVPGPAWAKYTRAWILKAFASGDAAKVLADVNQVYGPLARIGPNHIITNDPDVTRKVLAVRSRYHRAPWFDAMSIDPHNRNIISEKDSEKHGQLRSKLASSYTTKALASAEIAVDDRMLDWLERVKSQWMSEKGGGRGPSKTFDIGMRIQYLTIDIISKICLGAEFGYVASDSDTLDLLETIQRGSAACQLFSLFLELNTIMGFLAKIPFLAKLFIPSPADRTGIGRVMGVIRRKLDEIDDPKADSPDTMLASFLDKGVSREQVIGEMVIALVGGADTTPTSIQVTLLGIISNPRVYGKLKHEISDAVRRGMVSTPIIKGSEAKALPYLQACILEGLRTFPPLAQLREREVPPEGDVINGFHIPGGTFIGLNMWGTQLDPVFGEDPEVFRPERWMIDDAEKLKEMHNTQGLIFSYGSTKCLGMTLATMEISKMVFELLRNFDMTIANPGKPLSIVCNGIFLLKDFNVHLTPATFASDHFVGQEAL